MASPQIVETSVTNNSPSQDSYHPDDLFQSSYVLMSGKLNATGLRWVGELADFNFEIRYRPGKSNTDADSLSRIPADF